MKKYKIEANITKKSLMVYTGEGLFHKLHKKPPQIQKLPPFFDKKDFAIM